jgi:CBS domain-containing protein
VIVKDGDSVSGIITERDIVNVVADGQDPLIRARRLDSGLV